jgi:hypothetical protein
LKSEGCRIKGLVWIRQQRWASSLKPSAFPGTFDGFQEYTRSQLQTHLTKISSGVGSVGGAVGTVSQAGVGDGGGSGHVGAAVVAGAVGAVVGIGVVLGSSHGHEGENQDHLKQEK